MEKNIKDLSVVELKALAYDQLALLERAQRNIQTINQEIAGREENKKDGTE